ncbi:hypothetical protein BDV28DRAFT_115602 [Aspergillus coremiiformis]|uniref:Bul1 C-terminal domain-containing protein n=1 Tax=Aspergillus coremiiformis TaxID=138285 RepID=A0A5N6Z5U1_9EURO|nr:hypothetical protein BDV28DRAFT_115602 [Aspergillus coremiiformis]
MKAAEYLPQFITTIFSNLTQKMEIHLTKTQTVFTTGETIQGELVLPRRYAPQYAYICIALIGSTTTTVPIGTSFPNNGRTIDCTFLNIRHIETLEPWHHQLVFSFSFVIPDALLFDSCSDHLPTGSGSTRQDHRQLPPSMDHHSDRFCPEMSSIIYHIRAEVDNGSERLHVSQRIHLLPLYPEQPPRLWTQAADHIAQMTDSTDLRMNRLGTKAGRITIRAKNIRPLYQPPGQHGSTLTPIRLHLDLDSLPPEPTFPPHCRVRVTLKAVTYFTTVPMTELPRWENAVNEQRQLFRTSVCSWKNKSVRLQWIESDLSPRASLVIPIPVSCNVALLPTFYHCYVARAYFVKVEVVIGCSRKLRVKVPVRIYNS